MSSSSARSTEGPGGPSRRSFHVESLGCAKNQVDSEIMIAALTRAGWALASGPDEADAIIVNTCGFISSAKAESIETSLELKERHPGTKVFMVGCLSERHAEDLRRELPEIDGFLGAKDPSAVVHLLDEGAPSEPAAPTARIHLLSYPGSAYVKIAEGCNNRCTYCAIPLIRGDLASRDQGEILGEIRGLFNRGIVEIILIAQDLGSYGRDRGAAGLKDLLEGIASLPGYFWLRLLYIHPDHFPREILDVFARDPRFLPYFDVPFQHGSPPVLRAMGRKDDPERNLALLTEIRARVPGAFVRSTFLVGFPGETEGDFQRLLRFQDRARLDWLGAFTWSREEGTPAFSFPDRVGKRIARERKEELERRQIPITEAALDACIGRTVDVLAEEVVVGKDLFLGRAYLQAPDVDGLVVVHGRAPAGTRCRVRLTRRNGVDLEGEALDG